MTVEAVIFKENQMGKLLLILFTILLFSCDSSHIVSVETYNYKCGTCGYEWAGSGFAVGCPRCNLPFIEMVGE